MLEGKRVLITGGSRGLGRSICLDFAQRGARVAFTWTRAEAEAAATLEELPEGRAFQVSVLDGEGTRQMARTLEQDWGGVDVLVNNAGITQNLPLALLEEDDWDRVMDINAKGVYLTSRALIRGMIRRKSGIILNIGSLAGQRMLDAPIHYCTSKAAVSGFTMALARQVARHRIRVLCLAPGLLEGGVGVNLPPHRLRDYLDHCALGRPGKFSEVAAFAAFLVSDENSFMTGETVVMDGSV